MKGLKAPARVRQCAVTATLPGVSIKWIRPAKATYLANCIYVDEIYKIRFAEDIESRANFIQVYKPI